jgi:CheY-like chemotaxis protein
MPTILLVDNDPFQASVCKSILEQRFSNVQRVGDAAEALCLVEQPRFAGRLGLVITDLNMPGIGSPAFVAELHVRLPRVPVLVLGDDAELAAGYDARWVRFLSRPFADQDILTAASELLALHAWEVA